MDRIEATENGAVVDGDVPGTLGRIGNHDVVTDLAVVGQMHVGHDEAARPHRGFKGGGGAPIDRGIFADDGAFAHLDPGFLPLILEVLRVTTEDRAVSHVHIIRQPDVPLESYPRRQAAAVAHYNVGANDGVRPDGYSLPQLGR